MATVFVGFLILHLFTIFSEFSIAQVEAYRDVAGGNYRLSGAGDLRRRQHQQPDDYHVKKLEAFKASLAARRAEESLISPSPPYHPPPPDEARAREYHLISYGADPTGISDSTEALLKAFSDASKAAGDGELIGGIRNVGGVSVNLDGGIYLISRPLRFPTTGVGNIVIHGGTLKASATFPPNGYLIELATTSPPPSSTSEKHFHNGFVAASYDYEYITFRDLLLDSAFRGGGLAVINSLRTTVNNLYITHFTTDGILVRSGHETLIHHTYLGQHITAGADPGERNFSGTAVALIGNDNHISDVVVFSAAIGVLVSGQANLISGLHCYNKATGYGGVGVYLRLPGLTQTRIIGSYMDYTGIVAEDPVQLVVANNFFLGDAAVTFKAVNGVVNGVSVVDNMFSGSGSGVPIVKLDGSFREVEQVAVERNSVSGMTLKATSARVHVEGNGGTTWTADFNGMLLFPDLIRHVQYSALTVGNNESYGGGNFREVNFVMRNVAENRVVLESDVAVGNSTSIYLMVDQGF